MAAFNLELMEEWWLKERLEILRNKRNTIDDEIQKIEWILSK